VPSSALQEAQEGLLEAFTLRRVLHDLADLLAEREKIGKEIQEALDRKTNPWGITILSIEFTDIVIPKELEDAMSKRAQAERERQSRVILGTAEIEISDKFVEAAKLRGESSLHIMFREILPNVLPPLAVEASMRFSYAIFLVASLGFLGLGVQPPSPDWGLMVGEARNYFSQAQWALLAPAGAVAVLVVGVGFMSDGLRRMLLPGGVSR